MEKSSKIYSEGSRIDRLEHELHLKKLQMNSLLAITQAINNNVNEQGLYAMYRSFITWDLAIPKLALCVTSNDKWEIATQKNITVPDNFDYTQLSSRFKEPSKIQKGEHPFLEQFDFAIPVRHKNQPIACAFLGGMEENESTYDKIQVITAITNFIAVALENKRLFRAKLEQELIQKEFQLATEIQEMLLPKNLPQEKNFELSKIYRQHSQVGGDYYDYFPLGDKRFAFCIADVAGKGISAALLMANFQAVLRGLIFQKSTLKELVTTLNHSIFQVTKGERFITFFIGIIDFNDNSLTYVNAGHIPPIFAQANTTKTLRKGCLILGATETLPFVQIGHETIDETSLIFSFTDGVTDLTNEKGQYLTEEKLIHFTNQHFHLPPKEFNDTLFQHVNKFKGDLPFPDDFTVLTCKVKPYEESSGN